RPMKKYIENGAENSTRLGGNPAIGRQQGKSLRSRKERRRVLHLATVGDAQACYDYICLRCGRQEPEITQIAEHMVSLTKGNTSDNDQLQPFCLSCNKSKGAKIIDCRQ